MAASRSTKRTQPRKSATKRRSTAAAGSKAGQRSKAKAVAKPRSTRVSANAAAAPRSRSTRTAKSAGSSTPAKTRTSAAKTTRTGNPAAARRPSGAATTRIAEKASKTRARTSAKPEVKAKALTRGSVTHERRRGGDKLAVYRSKRDFGRTPEPEGGRTGAWKSTGNPYFVIQKHAASRLHYDFRLEVDGVLKSWAVPKGPSMDPQVKRLAVEVEDHPVEYADFEGIIPQDEYGGGTVIVWDAGPYRNLKKTPLGEAHDKGQIEIWLEGRKLRGGFALVHTRMDEKGKNWLLIKMKDETAGSGDPVEERPESVLSGRTIEEVAGRPGRVWSSR